MHVRKLNGGDDLVSHVDLSTVSCTSLNSEGIILNPRINFATPILESRSKQQRLGLR